MIAFTRAVSPGIIDCELTHMERESIDFDVAVEQHQIYEKKLESLGCEVIRFSPENNMPDSVFVEDTAVILPEIAVITRPGAKSRRGEVQSVADKLKSYKPLAFLSDPATLEGGDVLHTGKKIFIGQSTRTNDEGIHQFKKIVSPLGYEVQAVPFKDCLHLKTAVTQTSNNQLVYNPAWVDAGEFEGYHCIGIHPDEPFAANVLRIGSVILISSAFPKTRGILEKYGLQVQSINVSELAKAEAGLTCCSLLMHE